VHSNTQGDPQHDHYQPEWPTVSVDQASAAREKSTPTDPNQEGSKRDREGISIPPRSRVDDVTTARKIEVVHLEDRDPPTLARYFMRPFVDDDTWKR
jgi:hypothetical protein